MLHSLEEFIHHIEGNFIFYPINESAKIVMSEESIFCQKRCFKQKNNLVNGGKLVAFEEEPDLPPNPHT